MNKKGFGPQAIKKVLASEWPNANIYIIYKRLRLRLRTSDFIAPQPTVSSSSSCHRRDDFPSPRHRHQFPRDGCKNSIEKLKNRITRINGKIRTRGFHYVIVSRTILSTTVWNFHIFVHVLCLRFYTTCQVLPWLFYTAKNIIMMIFLLYRLWVIFSGMTEDAELSDDSVFET